MYAQFVVVLCKYMFQSTMLFGCYFLLLLWSRVKTQFYLNSINPSTKAVKLEC